MGFGGSGNAPQQRFTPEDMRATTQLSAEIVHPRVPAPAKVDLDSSEEERLALEAQLVAADAVALAAAEVRRRARSALAPIPGRWAAATGRTAEDAAVLAELLAEALEPLEAQADAALGGGPPGAGT